jgi:two-component system sensor histidine kinase UhpB
MAVQERERVALARELHDELAQDCTSIRIEAAYLRRATDAEMICATAERAADAASRLQDGLRGVLRKHRPAELDELGLASALESLVTAHERRSGGSCDLLVEGSVDDLGPTVDTTVYRVVQEALSNVARRAHGTCRSR